MKGKRTDPVTLTTETRALLCRRVPVRAATSPRKRKIIYVRARGILRARSTARLVRAAPILDNTRDLSEELVAAIGLASMTVD
jgi:hypothetical protein